MQVALRRIIIVSAISLVGAVSGFALGNFASGGPRTGLDELAEAHNSSVRQQRPQAHAASDVSFAPRSGPSSYRCQGCDASLYNDVMPAGVDISPAETAPLPPYRAEDDDAARPGFAARRTVSDRPLALPDGPGVVADKASLAQPSPPRAPPAPVLPGQ